MSDPWQELIDKNWNAFAASREARGIKSTPLPPDAAKLIREMPNLFLDAVIFQKLNFGSLD